MDNSEYLVIDSGRGGLNVLKTLYNLPNFADFYYLSDGRSAPYGDKSEAFLTARARALIEEYGKGFCGIIFACNTLSTTASEKLKSEYPFPIFGVQPVEPKGKTLLLCTAATARSARVTYLKNRGDLTVSTPEGLVCAIEDNLSEILRGDFSSVVGLLPEDNGYKSVVLGCTHFIFLKSAVKKIYQNADIYDGTEELVGSLLKSLCISRGILTTAISSRKIERKFFLGDEGRLNYDIFCQMMG